MKKILFVVSLFLLVSICLTSCDGYQTYYDNSVEMQQVFEENYGLFYAVAIEELGYGESVFISTYDSFRPEGADEDATGLYVHDTLKNETRLLDSALIERLFANCNVNSLGVKYEDNIRICEFSIGGGRQYYNGIYYVEPDRALFLNNFSIPLEEDGDGFSYSVENMNYYTEKWGEHFYYYVAKTL